MIVTAGAAVVRSKRQELSRGLAAWLRLCGRLGSLCFDTKLDPMQIDPRDRWIREHPPVGKDRDDGEAALGRDVEIEALGWPVVFRQDPDRDGF
jgi:hypothetical protein